MLKNNMHLKYMCDAVAFEMASIHMRKPGTKHNIHNIRTMTFGIMCMHLSTQDPYMLLAFEVHCHSTIITAQVDFIFCEHSNFLLKKLSSLDSLIQGLTVREFQCE